MMTIRPAALTFLLLLAGFMLAGCQSAAIDNPGRQSPAGPTYEGYYKPRNPYFLPKPILALDSLEMHRLASAAPAGDDHRWYDDRNDWRHTVTSGYQTSTYESISTRTYDRQYQHGSQVRDHYSQWTRRGSYSETVR